MAKLLALVFLVASAASAQTVRESNVVLDAAEKHIVREHYHDDEAVTLVGNAAGGWHLYAGAAVDAQRIDLRMHNVRGQMHFRADWSRISAMLQHAEARATTTRKQ
jgi:hypothetical protein